MSERETTVKDAIAQRLVDGNGGFNDGIEFAFSVQDIVNDLNVPDCSENRRIIQVEILRELKKYREDFGVMAGGVERDPTLYFIAKTEAEEKAIMARYVKFTKSYMNGIKSRAKASNFELVQSITQAIEGMFYGLNALLISFDSQEEKDRQLKLDK